MNKNITALVIILLLTTVSLSLSFNFLKKRSDGFSLKLYDFDSCMTFTDKKFFSNNKNFEMFGVSARMMMQYFKDHYNKIKESDSLNPKYGIPNYSSNMAWEPFSQKI